MLGLLEIIEQFQISGAPERIKLFGDGHINKTYKVSTREVDEKDYLLQKINHKVFPDVNALMDNIYKVTSYIKKKPSSDHQRVLSIIPTLNDQFFYEGTGGYWRVFPFLGDARSYEKAETEEQAFEAAKMFGSFLKDLSDFPPRELHITIQDFHNVTTRLKQFEKALLTADSHCIHLAYKQIKLVKKYRSAAEKLYNSASSGELPLRVTHNDTKFNNVLLDKENNGYAVIDLDTVMPGYVFYDIGDGIRTGVITAEEDEQNLDLVGIDEAKYESYVRGYLEGAGGILTSKELQSIPEAGFYMAFIMGVRFLTDYLNGSIYYPVDFPDHNYYRARCQLYLASLFKQKEKEMRRLL